MVETAGEGKDKNRRGEERMDIAEKGLTGEDGGDIEIQTAVRS